MRSSKKLRASFFVIAILLLLTKNVLGQENLSSGVLPSPTPANQLQGPFERLSDIVTKFQLSNGLRVIFVRRNQAPVFSGQTWVKVGGVNEVPGMTGIAHMLEHMAFKGSKEIGTKDYEKEKFLLSELETLIHASRDGQVDPKSIKDLQEKLRELWVDNEYSRIYKREGAVGLNASTSKDYTDYVISLPAVAFEIWCWMESDRLLNPVFRQFYEEREVVLEERRWRYEDDPEGKLYEALLETAFWSHPNRLPVIGWSSDVKRLTATDIERFYRTYYRPDNMVLSLVGDLDLEVVRPLLEKYFGRLERVDSPLPQINTVEEPQEGERKVIIEFNAEPAFMMGYHKTVYPHPDDAVFTILHSLLSSGRSSLFQKEFVQERQLVSSIYTSEAPGELFPPIFFIGATPNQGVTSEHIRDEIQKMLDRLRERKFSEEELMAAKRRLKVGFIEGLESNGSLAGTLGKSELLWNDWKAIFKAYDQAMEVSADDIQRVIKTYLVLKNRTFVTIQKPAKPSSAQKMLKKEI